MSLLDQLDRLITFIKFDYNYICITILNKTALVLHCVPYLTFKYHNGPRDLSSVFPNATSDFIFYKYILKISYVYNKRKWTLQ